MEAESIRARRPVHPVIVRSLASRLRMPLSAFLVALLLLGPGLASALFTAPAPAHAATPAATPSAPDTVSVEVAPAGSSIVNPGQPLAVTVRITNTTTEQVDAGSISVYLAQRALTTRSALDRWLRPEKPADDPGDLMVTAPSTTVQPGGTMTFDVTVPAKSIPLGAANAWGARGIAATLTTGGEVRAQGRGTFVWYDDEDVTPAQLAVAMPITVPAGSEGLIPAEELASYTDPTGLLSRQLDGVIDRPVAIAIDPMIIASIRILGSSAPPSATGWLERLSQAENDIFPLSYADADIALQAQAGSKTVLAPISFDWLIDPDLFIEPPPGPEETSTVTPTPGATDTPTPSPTPTPGPGIPPTSAGLLDWDYTMTDVGWPGAGVVAKDDLDVFAASGLTTTILDGSNVKQSAAASRTPNAVFAMGSGRGLATDDALSDALRTAARAGTDDEWRAAMAEVSSQLAVVAAEQPGTARTLLATLDRGWQAGPNRLGQTIDALAGLPWQSPATLREARTAPPATDVTFRARAEPDARVDLGRLLLSREAEIDAFSTALEDPVTVTGAHRLELLALLATSWGVDPDGWQEAVSTSLAASGEILRSVTVTTKGPINVVGSKVDVPITLSNSLGQAVSVRVRVVPSNGRLVVGDDVEATVDADSARTVFIPVTAAIGNGDVTLRVSLFTPDGTRIDRPAQIPVSVHADWEGLGSLIFAVIVITFFGFGVWRNILRRRRERVATEVESSEVGTGNGAGEGTATDVITTPAADERG
jgi:hypothetical protein